jgi:hypothetical protein
MDTSDYSFGYVLGWTGGAPDAIEGIKASTGRIQKAATAVLRTFEVQEPPVAAVNSIGIDIDTDRSADMDPMLPNDERSKGGLVEFEYARDVDPRVEPDGGNRNHRYQPLSTGELEAWFSTPCLNWDHEIGGQP